MKRHKKIILNTLVVFLAFLACSAIVSYIVISSYSPTASTNFADEFHEKPVEATEHQTVAGPVNEASVDTAVALDSKVARNIVSNVSEQEEIAVAVSDQVYFPSLDEPALSASTPQGDFKVKDLVPRHWKLGSPHFTTYVEEFVELSSDYKRVWNGTASARLVAKQEIQSYETAGIGQLVFAEPFAGTRIRYSGFLLSEPRSSAYPASGMIWIRADDPEGRVVAFQNTMGRFRSGGIGWSQHVIVIDIPPTAYTLSFGASLVGYGSVWADNISIEEVDADVAPTSRPYTGQRINVVPESSRITDRPRNLDFEDTREQESN